MKSPEVMQQLGERGIETAPSAPAELGQFVRAEEKKWVPVIKRANIKPE